MCIYVYSFYTDVHIYTQTPMLGSSFYTKGSLLFCNLLFPFNSISYKSLQISHRDFLNSFCQLCNNGTLLFGCMNMFIQSSVFDIDLFPNILLLKIMPQSVKLCIFFFTLLKMSLQGRFLEVGLLGGEIVN